MSEFHPLSNDEIIAKLESWGHHVNFIPYKELCDVESLLDVMPCILLYQRMMGVAGHWCLLFMNRDKDHHPVVNYFDPTGHIPDGLITDMIPDEQDRKVMNADFTYLIDLLLKLNNQGLKIDYNQYPLQPPDTNGCGAFCTLRLLCKQMSTKEFASILMPIEPMKRELIVEKLWKIL